MECEDFAVNLLDHAGRMTCTCDWLVIEAVGRHRRIIGCRQWRRSNHMLDPPRADGQKDSQSAVVPAFTRAMSACAERRSPVTCMDRSCGPVVGAGLLVILIGALPDEFVRAGPGVDLAACTPPAILNTATISASCAA